jgi:PAS domain S-box-containing protein
VTHAILDGSAAGIALLDRNLRYLYVNESLAKMNGVPSAEHFGRRARDVVPDLVWGPIETMLHQVLRDGRPQFVTVTGRTPADDSAEQRWWINAYHRVADDTGHVLGVAAEVLEVTETHRVQQELDNARTRLAMLDEAATRIGTTLDVGRTCRELARLLVPRLADIVAVDMLDTAGEPGKLTDVKGVRLRRMALKSTTRMALAAEYFGIAETVITPHKSSALARCLIEERPVVGDLAHEPAGDCGLADQLSPDQAAAHRVIGPHAALFVPLNVGHSVVGAVTLVRTGPPASFSQWDIDLAADLARRAATNINNASRFSKEHEIALILQRALLAQPTPPHPNVEVASRYLPAGTSTEIGGDWFDMVALPDGETLLVVGDVMGHGIEAAATMSEYRSLLRTLALQGRTPAEILAEAARILPGLGVDRATTCLVTRVNPKRGTFTFANAGHMPPLLIRPDGPAMLFDLPICPPLGVITCEYSQVTLPWPAESVLLLYTDGLVERRGEDIEQSLAHLAELDLDASDPLDQLLDTVLTSLDPSSSGDDVALLAARLL